MFLTVLSVQCICVWMMSGCVLVDGDYSMNGPITCHVLIMGYVINTLVVKAPSLQCIEAYVLVGVKYLLYVVYKSR